MEKYEKVRSTIKPESFTIDDYSVWINTNITRIEENIGEDKFIGFEYTQIRYTKDEYIEIINKETQQNKADIDYLSMMTDVDLGGK